MTLAAGTLPSTPLMQARFENMKQPGKDTLQKLADHFGAVADLAKANDESGTQAKAAYRKAGGRIGRLEDLIAACRAVCGSTDAAGSSGVRAALAAAPPKRLLGEEAEDGEGEGDEDGGGSSQPAKRSRPDPNAR